MKTTMQHQRHTIFLGEDNNIVFKLICINLVVYLLLNFIRVIYFLYGFSYADFYDQIMPWVVLPSSWHGLVTHPWTLLTFMFVHLSFWHILSNMLWFWVFGRLLQDFAGYQKVAPVYLYGGLAGGALFVLSYHIFPIFRPVAEQSTAFGASASVMAIAFAVTLLIPRFRFFPMVAGGIPLWVVTVIFVLVDLASIPHGNAGGHIAHLGGAAFGALFMWQLQRGHDWSAGMQRMFVWVNGWFDPERRQTSHRPHKEEKTSAYRTSKFYRSDVPPFKKVSRVSEKKIDEILDKINEQGFHSLTREEREILKRASQEDIQ
ncbi:MAG: rhomboid family intramembrane serine protease [Thermoflavifilum aggregans]|nr:rhomboid family intramembrane serine protease [Thermoflavifilum aggregans]